MATLTQAWTSTAAALPLQWEIAGLAFGPRESDPRIRGPVWVAWARGPGGARATGEGASPDQALLALARRLVEIRGSQSG